MDWVLISIWILVPVAFYLLALWSYLEQSTQVKKGKKRNREPQDLLSQAIFITICSVITFLIDTFIFKAGAVDWIFGEWFPKPLVRTLSYLVVLYVGAMMYGGSKPTRIENAPRPSEKYKYRK